LAFLNFLNRNSSCIKPIANKFLIMEINTNVLGSDVVELLDRDIKTIHLSQECSLENIRLKIKVIDSPYLITNRIRVLTETDNPVDQEVAEVELIHNWDNFSIVDMGKLRLTNESGISRITFLCDYDIEFVVQIIKSTN
jgi:hypothetical protein